MTIDGALMNIGLLSFLSIMSNSISNSSNSCVSSEVARIFSHTLSICSRSTGLLRNSCPVFSIMLKVGEFEVTIW